ncbi:hypothetical protein [Microbacterium sp.]|uniref:hypothetical protein n=1 Tax=Microbacterium sp. TaxID=51671 RepID=UPI0039E6236D
MANEELSTGEMVRRVGLGSGLAIGIGLGVALGFALHNLALGIGLGVTIGMIIMVAFTVAGARLEQGGAASDVEENSHTENPDAEGPASDPDPDPR